MISRTKWNYSITLTISFLKRYIASVLAYLFVVVSR